jgi:hypothetical protein
MLQRYPLPAAHVVARVAVTKPTHDLKSRMR